MLLSFGIAEMLTSPLVGGRRGAAGEGIKYRHCEPCRKQGEATQHILFSGSPRPLRGLVMTVVYSSLRGVVDAVAIQKFTGLLLPWRSQRRSQEP